MAAMLGPGGPSVAATLGPGGPIMGGPSVAWQATPNGCLVSGPDDFQIGMRAGGIGHYITVPLSDEMLKHLLFSGLLYY